MNGSSKIVTRLEVEGFVILLRKGFLSASPMAPIVADPYAYCVPERKLSTPFIFSDIPDTLFRKPDVVFQFSRNKGGSKS